MKTIQIIEDSGPLRQLLNEFFVLKGFRVIESINGQEALDMLENENPDLILLDILMPKVNGLQVIQAVKRSKQIPIIVMSSQAMADVICESVAMGISDYIVKPFSMNDLLARVETVLEQGESVIA